MQHLLEISGVKHRARGQNLPAKASNPTAGTTLYDFDCEDGFFDFKLCIYNFYMTFSAD